ncbi:lactonase family protein [Cryptosporangium phraense]|uniref:Lactonase family protein n=1 Tax=Cryptosporangium phraense TaxID=2593070 RepID=A0A545ATT3_9ACTN|nr:beta-propeller fold lactonase family protein [Cryptosporangium phraense]TQS44736.1 lactonase family protein [Cryptosporangium phraense]
MTRLVVGTYTADMNGSGAGLLVRPGGALDTPSPSYVIASAGVLYAVNEGAGTVSSYALGPGGAPELRSTASTGGTWPCHLALADGYLLAANYGSGSVSVHPVADGIVGPATDLVRHSGSGPDADRQEGPHAHQVVPGPDGRVTVVDLGIDRLVEYRLASGRLERLAETVLPPGSGPRHVVTHPSGRRYVAAELGSAVLTLEGGSVVASTPATAKDGPNQPSAIVLTGDHLYLANRGADTIAAFRLDSRGVPAPLAEVPCGGAWPRDLALVGGGLVAANERSHGLAYFDLVDGVPVPTGRVDEVGSPTCVLPLP